MKTGPFDLDETRAILAPDGGAIAKNAGPDFYAELDSEFDGFAGHTLIQRFEFDSPWPTWEMHPKGDEFVYLLFGVVDFVLAGPGGERQTLRVDRPGQFVLVPRGTWHTARPLAASAMLFVTPGEGTLNEAQPPD